MKYLISENKLEIEKANQIIFVNMGLNRNQDFNIVWDTPRQINARSGEGINTVQPHPVYLIDQTKLGWWAIQKPEDRFMDNVINVQEVGE